MFPFNIYLKLEKYCIRHGKVMCGLIEITKWLSIILVLLSVEKLLVTEIEIAKEMKNEQP